MRGQDQREARLEQRSNGERHPAGDRGDRQAKIRGLNDRLRQTGAGGMVVMTDGIAALGLSTVNGIFRAIALFDRFTPENDPWGEHDCALQTVSGLRVLWKIDLYEQPRVKDANGEPVVTRVLTIMRADEY